VTAAPARERARGPGLPARLHGGRHTWRADIRVSNAKTGPVLAREAERADITLRGGRTCSARAPALLESRSSLADTPRGDNIRRPAVECRRTQILTGERTCEPPSWPDRRYKWAPQRSSCVCIRVPQSVILWQKPSLFSPAQRRAKRHNSCSAMSLRVSGERIS